MAAEWAMRLTPEPLRDFLSYESAGLVGLYLTLERLQVALDPDRGFEASAPLRRGPEAA